LLHQISTYPICVSYNSGFDALDIMKNPLKNPSVDWWSLILALAAAALIRAGLAPHIPW
jgi:hypothetical protein